MYGAEEFRRGWQVLVCSFIVQIFTIGLGFSLGGLYVSWLEEFQDSKALTSWIVSLLVAILLGIAPIPAALMERYGNRPVQMAGSVLACAGFGLSTLVNSVPQLILTLGVLGGVGLGFCYLPAIIMPAQYFVKRRALAYGITTAGVGIGAFILPPFIAWLEMLYGWRGALLIVGGILLNLSLCGMLMKPLPKNHVVMELDIQPEDDYNDVTNNPDIQIEGLPLVTPEGMTLMGVEVIDDVIPNYNNNIDDALPKYDDELSLTAEACPEIRINQSDNDSQCSRPFNKFLDVERLGKPKQKLVVGGSFQNLPVKSPKSKAFSSASELRRGSKASQENSDKDLESSKGSYKNIDIMLFGSILSLKLIDEKLGSKKSLDYNTLMSKTKNTYEDDDDDDESQLDNKHTSQFKKKKRSGLAVVLAPLVDHFSLLKDRSFFSLGASTLLTNLSYLMPVLYMVDRAVENGIDKQTSTMLMSINGIGNIAGRFLFGLFADFSCADSVVLYMTTLTIVGVGTSLSFVCGGELYLHICYAAFFGFFMGGYTSLAPVTCVDIMGVSRVGQAYGILLFFQGVAGALGPPLAGWVYDWLDGFTWAFILHGVFIVLSAAVLIPVTVTRLCRHKGRCVSDS